MGASRNVIPRFAGDGKPARCKTRAGLAKGNGKMNAAPIVAEIAAAIAPLAAVGLAVLLVLVVIHAYQRLKGAL